MTDAELPEGWGKSVLRDLVEGVQPGFACGTHNRDGEGVPHIRPMNVSGEGRIDLSVLKFVPKTHADRDERWVRSGDVIFNNTNSPELVGKTALYSLPERRAFSNHMTRVRCNVAVLNPAYCAAFLQQQWRTGHFLRICNNHVSQASVASSVLLDTIIDLPPLAEQRRIVAKVEELLARVNAARERLAKIPTILKRFRQSILAAACSGMLTAEWRDENQQTFSASETICRVQADRMKAYHLECKTADNEGRRKPTTPSNLNLKNLDNESTIDIPDCWMWLSFEDIASSRPHAMSSGPFGSALGSKDYRTSGVPVIRAQNIQMGAFVANNFVFVSEEKAKELSRSSAYPGDIVVVAVGVTAGNAAVVPSTNPRGVLSQNCNKMTVDTSLVVADFVVMTLQLDLARNQLRDKTTDTARPFLSLTNLKETRLPVPPLAEQKEIVRRVEALFALVEKIEARVQAATARVEKTTQAILAKAFRGEIVPTEAELARRESRPYEPASALLARLRAEKVSADSNGDRRRRRPIAPVIRPETKAGKSRRPKKQTQTKN